jgi:tetratricopeptide (TPR) repeat protein
MVLLPVLLLVVLEAALRVAGYGYSPAFFNKAEYGGTTVAVYGRSFTRRFFPATIERWPEAFMFEVKKPAATRRIFVLGASAAMGDPQPAYAASRFLEVLLKDRFPGRDFEVINLGITAINSHVVLPIARACAPQESDAWILYLGNNEMVGPYGASTVFGRRGAPLAVARAETALQATRLGQLGKAFASRIRSGGDDAAAWEGMAMFLENRVPPEDPRRERVYENFRNNLEDILLAGTRSGVPVLLNTVSVNLLDCPPFASEGVEGVTGAGFQTHFDAGAELEEGGQYAEAAARFEQASRIRPKHAEALYRQGRCLLQTGGGEAAAELLRQACDYDTLAFRADRRINGIIRELASQYPSTAVRLCDAEAYFNRLSPAGIAGPETFFEHVHFNPTGSYRLALLWAQSLPELLRLDAGRLPEEDWLEQADCERRLGLTVYHRAVLLEDVIKRMEVPPLNGQYNNRVRMDTLHSAMETYRRQMENPAAMQEARTSVEQAVQRAPDDPFLYAVLGELLEDTGRKEHAAEAYRIWIRLRPYGFYGHLKLGVLTGSMGRLEEARALLEQTVEIRPSLAEGWLELGMVLLALNDFDAAVDSFSHGHRYQRGNRLFVHHIEFSKGKQAADRGNHAEAAAHYREAIQAVPQLWKSHFELGVVLDASGKITEAAQAFGDAARLHPDSAVIQMNHGVTLAKLRRFVEAERAFEKALVLDPDNRQIQAYLRQARMFSAQKR